jgi:type II secretory pathway component PulM
MRLTKREQQFAVALTIIVVAWLVHGLVIKPICERTETLERVLPEKAEELAEVQARSSEYVALSKGYADMQTRLAAQDANFDPLSFLESMIERHQLSGRLVNMQRDTLQPEPGRLQTVVEISFEDIALGEMTSLLADVEASEPLMRIASLHISRSQSGKSLDVTVQICNPEPDQSPVAASL